MPTREVVVQLSVIGVHADNFTIGDDIGLSQDPKVYLATNVSRDALLNGYTVYADTAANTITVTSDTLDCTNSLEIIFPSPSPTPIPTPTPTRE